MTDRSPRELAEAYAEALESQADGDEYEEAKERLEAYRERLGRFEESYGESDPATRELREKVQSAEDEVEGLEKERREPVELERELLQAATKFMLNDEWLQPGVIEALNRALTGTSHPTLRVEDVELSGREDSDELDDIDRYDIIDIVRKIAMDKLGEDDDLERLWRSIESSTKEEPFRVVSERGEVTPKDVAAVVEEDIDGSTARNRMSNAVHQLDINPYHRDDGVYSLSTAGRYIAAEYAGINGAAPEEPRSDDGQMKLGEEAAADGGGTDE